MRAKQEHRSHFSGRQTQKGVRDMLTKKLILAATVAALSVGSIGTALAFNPYTNGTVYFDENGQVVGQQVLSCDSTSWHGGNIHTAYHVSTSALCGFGCPPRTDPSKPNTCPTPPTYIVPGTIVTAYVLPSFETIQQACSLMEDQCTVPPARLLDRGWTWTPGWQ
jgi:hypothetical protein